jgi:hypothetical protein
VCDHLTDFAVLLEERSTGTCATGHEAIYRITLGVYGVVAAAASLQLVRIFWAGRQDATNLAAQHALCLATAITRGMSAARFGDLFSASRGVVGLVTALPWCLVFWSFTLMVLHWAKIFHFSMGKIPKSAVAKMRGAYLLVNALVVGVVVVLFASMVSDSASIEQARVIAVAGSIFLFAFSAVLAGVFMVYGALLHKSIRAGAAAREKHSHQNCWQKCRNPSLSRKMLTNACVVALLFLLQTAMYMCAAFDFPLEADAASEARSRGYTAAYLAADGALGCAHYLLQSRQKACLRGL